MASIITNGCPAHPEMIITMNKHDQGHVMKFDKSATKKGSEKLPLSINYNYFIENYTS